MRFIAIQTINRIPALIVAIIVLGYCYNNFFSTGILEGTYVNRNYGYHFIGHISDVPDTLYLKKDNHFESPFYGKGKYTLKYTLGGTKINLHYGEESVSTYINRIWFIGNPKIILFEDLNQYYEKIE